MKRIRDVNLIPPGGYRWYCKAHGIRFKADFFPELVEKVKNYMVANHMDMPLDLPGHLQHEMCEQNEWGLETCYVIDDPS
jgi:hypothetical protein